MEWEGEPGEDGKQGEQRRREDDAMEWTGEEGRGSMAVDTDETGRETAGGAVEQRTRSRWEGMVDGLLLQGTDAEYVQLRANRVRGRLAKHKRKAGEQCGCRPHRGETCLKGCESRQARRECIGCRLGEACENNVIQRGAWQPTVVIETEHRGRGLAFVEDTPANTVALEYVGEVVREDDAARRRVGHANTYQHEFVPGWVIDARMMGGPARFVNSSHRPNAVYEVWQVGTVPHLVLRTLKAIKAGEEILVFYRAGGQEGTEICRCGEDNCPGLMAGRPLDRKMPGDPSTLTEPSRPADEAFRLGRVARRQIADWEMRAVPREGGDLASALAQGTSEGKETEWRQHLWEIGGGTVKGGGLGEQQRLVQHYANVTGGVVIGIEWQGQVRVFHPDRPREGRELTVIAEARRGVQEQDPREAGPTSATRQERETGTVEFCRVVRKRGEGAVTAEMGGPLAEIARRPAPATPERKGLVESAGEWIAKTLGWRQDSQGTKAGDPVPTYDNDTGEEERATQGRGRADTGEKGSHAEGDRGGKRRRSMTPEKDARRHVPAKSLQPEGSHREAAAGPKEGLQEAVRAAAVATRQLGRKKMRTATRTALEGLEGELTRALLHDTWRVLGLWPRWGDAAQRKVKEDTLISREEAAAWVKGMQGLQGTSAKDGRQRWPGSTPAGRAHHALQGSLDEEGAQVEAVPGDGNCMFECIARLDPLRGQQAGGSDHRAWRQLVCDGMASNPRGTATGREAHRKQVEALRKKGCHGDYACLREIARITGHIVVTWHPPQGFAQPQIVAPEDVYEGSSIVRWDKMLYLRHTAYDGGSTGNHYDVIRPPDGGWSESTWACIKRGQHGGQAIHVDDTD